MKALKFSLILMLSILGINTAFAELPEAGTYTLDWQSADVYEFNDTRYGDYYMQFVCPTDDGGFWLMCIDVWADITNQGNNNKGILPTDVSYTTSEKIDQANSYHSSTSFVRHFDANGEVDYERALPEEISITWHANYYSFTIVIDGYTFVMGQNDPKSKGKKDNTNIPFTYHNYKANGDDPGVSYEEFVKGEDDETGNPLQPARPTGIDTIDADSDAQIAFDGYNIRLGNTENVIVVDVTGRICLQTKSDNVDVSGLNNGFYIAKAGKQTLKFYKK